MSETQTSTLTDEEAIQLVTYAITQKAKLLTAINAARINVALTRDYTRSRNILTKLERAEIALVDLRDAISECFDSDDE